MHPVVGQARAGEEPEGYTRVRSAYGPVGWWHDGTGLFFPDHDDAVFDYLSRATHADDIAAMVSSTRVDGSYHLYTAPGGCWVPERLRPRMVGYRRAIASGSLDGGADARWDAAADSVLA